jgi:hypothetical protein
MDTKGAKNRERLDLGLEAILSGAESPRPDVVAIDLALSPGGQGGSKWTLGEATSSPPAKNDYEVLAEERKWSEIVRLADLRLSSADDVEAKLWWIRGHLGAFSMPVSFLSAPFDAVCRKLSPDSVTESIKPLLEETGLLVLQRLREVGDSAHALEVRGALERLGVREPRGGRERAGTSSFRSLESVVGPSAEAAAPHDVQVPVRRGGRKRVTWTLACLVIVVALVALDRLFPHIRMPHLDIAIESFEPPHGELQQATDTPGRRDPGGRLGALFYSIGEGARGDESESGPVTPQPSVSSRVQPESKPIPAESLPLRSKEEVNTRGPLEGSEFRERVERIKPSSFENRREELQGGAPHAVLPGSSPEGFEAHKTYRVLTPTSVLSAPSHGGRVIGQLERGDRVLVEGKLGRWLRLRSKKGRGGYVLVTDVEEVPGLNRGDQP